MVVVVVLVLVLVVGVGGGDGGGSGGSGFNGPSTCRIILPTSGASSCFSVA